MPRRIHFTTDMHTGYPMCSSGFGSGRRRSRAKWTTIAEHVTCKTCMKILKYRAACSLGVQS